VYMCKYANGEYEIGLMNVIINILIFLHNM
jgi:hypothetical protein